MNISFYINFIFLSFIGDQYTLLNYQTAAQRRNVPIMLGVDSIQKVYGSNNSLVPSAITKLVRNVGLTVCQSVSSIKVCIFNIKLLIVNMTYNLLYCVLIESNEWKSIWIAGVVESPVDVLIFSLMLC